MTANWNNTAVVVPVYNCADFLFELLCRTRKLFPAENIFVVNDASEDDSDNICLKSGVKLINFSRNQGKGAALQTGFRDALRAGFRFAVSMDGDLQHQPEDIPKLIDARNSCNAALVIGRRDFSIRKMPFPRILSNRITSRIVSGLSGTKIDDSQSGFRLYDLDVFRLLEFRSKRYQFETEVIFKYSRHGAVITFVDIETIYDGQPSYISHLRDIRNFLKVVGWELLRKRDMK
ncbi:MAG: glycosyltransferase family 2 protein [Candidatus Cloacimonetes bacterium]|nr:glycosyltransferase family 2 protein [Candidatus Cloacimonadota bacterium]